MRPADYRQLIERVACAGAILDVNRGRLTISGEIPSELGDRLRQYESEIVAILQERQRADVRTAALELWLWLEEGRLKEVDRPVTIQPGAVVLPEQLEFCVRQELQLAKGTSHRARISKQFLRALHAGIKPQVGCRH